MCLYNKRFAVDVPRVERQVNLVQSKSEVQVGSLQCGVVGNGFGRCSMFMFFLAGAIVCNVMAVFLGKS